MEKLPGEPNITRVLHSISIQIAEVDGNEREQRIIMLNPDAVPPDIVLAMLRAGVQYVGAVVRADKKKGGGK